MEGFRRFLPPLAIGVFVLSVAVVIASAGSTLGYDYQAYHGAAERLLAGQPLYDATADVAGPFAVYLYPPPFAVAFLPFALLPDAAGLWLWTGIAVVAVLAAIGLLPVRAEVRWLVLLLAAFDWPVVYSIKLGQVGPLLLLLFAVGWRWLERPVIAGAAIGAGALIKVQPALVVGWALLARRWRIAATAIAVMAIVSLVTLPVVGIDAWLDFPRLLARVSSPVATPHNFTVGAIAFQSGLDRTTAEVIQWVWVAFALALAVLAALRRSAIVGYLTAVVASQVVSPIVWDHYAIVLLLPTAWLLERRQWWAVAIPLATSILLLGSGLAALYPLAFAVALVAPIVVEGRRS